MEEEILNEGDMSDISDEIGIDELLPVERIRRSKQIEVLE